MLSWLGGSVLVGVLRVGTFSAPPGGQHQGGTHGAQDHAHAGQRGWRQDGHEDGRLHRYPIYPVHCVRRSTLAADRHARGRPDAPGAPSSAQETPTSSGTLPSGVALSAGTAGPSPVRPGRSTRASTAAARATPDVAASRTSMPWTKAVR